MQVTNYRMLKFKNATNIGASENVLEDMAKIL